MGNWSTEHAKARKVCPPGPCEACGAADAEVHHRNEDWTDHRPANLQRLCRSCHIKAHRSGKRCLLCDQPHKGLGYCDKHYQRVKKWGDPHQVKVNQHTPVLPEGQCVPPKMCAVAGCGSPTHAKSYCSKHAQQARRGTLGRPQKTKSEAALARWSRQ